MGLRGPKTDRKSGLVEPRDINAAGIYAVTPDGQLRSVIAGPTRYKVLDIASNGRVLVSHDRDDRVVEGLMADSATPVDISLRANSNANWGADDGRSTLIADLSTASYQTYFLKAGATPVNLGAGQPMSLSPDGRWAVAVPTEGRPLFLHPTGPGESRKLPDPDNIVFDNAARRTSKAGHV
jgi:hypothetical protein